MRPIITSDAVFWKQKGTEIEPFCFMFVYELDALGDV